jgi:anti-sigma regulatory factor (Ser/Thr protein kinase)
MTGPSGGERIAELRVPARPDRLRLIRAHVQEAGALAGLSEHALSDLVCAADEACQNIIRHGYGDSAGGDIVVAIARAVDAVALTLTDTAPPMPRDVLIPRTAECPERGGMGTQVICACVDGIDLAHGPDGRGNRLTLTKRMV